MTFLAWLKAGIVCFLEAAIAKMRNSFFFRGLICRQDITEFDSKAEIAIAFWKAQQLIMR